MCCSRRNRDSRFGSAANLKHQCHSTQPWAKRIASLQMGATTLRLWLRGLHRQAAQGGIHSGCLQGSSSQSQGARRQHISLITDFNPIRIKPGGWGVGRLMVSRRASPIVSSNAQWESVSSPVRRLTESINNRRETPTRSESTSMFTELPRQEPVLSESWSSIYRPHRGVSRRECRTNARERKCFRALTTITWTSRSKQRDSKRERS